MPGKTAAGRPKEVGMLAIVLFLNGMAVMILEMAGSRLLAPWLGTSVVVWTSLIGIILASLSLGYWLGGRLADRILSCDCAPSAKDAKSSNTSASYKKALRVLSLLFTVSAVFVLITAIIHKVILMILAPVPLLHLATIIAALILFAAPAVLFGMISPFAMRLAITGSATSGSTIGRLNAISTVGSIFGTFLGGFVLISWFGTVEIILGVAACQLISALIVSARPLAPKFFTCALLVFTLLGYALTDESLSATGAETRETPYNTIKITMGGYAGRPIIALSTDPGKAQSGAYVDDMTELAFPYTRYYEIATALKPSARRVLMLGGGGYSVPKWLLAGKSGLDAKNLRVDVVEIDPGITKAASDYLGLDTGDERIRIFHEDARIFSRRLAAGLSGAEAPAKGERYDLIFMDVFNSYYSVPFHVGTAEAAKELNALLDDDGVFLMNIISSLDGKNGKLFQAIHAAFAEHFPVTHVFLVHHPGQPYEVQNIMLLAAKNSRYTEAIEKGSFSVHVQEMLSHRWTKDLPGAISPLRDNFAPVERYTLGFLR